MPTPPCARAATAAAPVPPQPSGVAPAAAVQYRFLPLLLLLLVPILLSTGKDIGPMAEYPLPLQPPSRASAKAGKGKFNL